MKLAILDRDGTLNQQGEGFITCAQDWTALPGALDAVARLNRAGWHVVVACNQPGLGRGLFDATELNAVHSRMHRELAMAGARVEAVFYCPHTPDEGCVCRMPAPGLFQQIAERYGAEPEEIWVIAQDVDPLRAGAALGAHLHWVCADGCGEAPAQLPPGTVRHAGWQSLQELLAPDDPPAQAPAPAPQPPVAGA